MSERLRYVWLIIIAQSGRGEFVFAKSWLKLLTCKGGVSNRLDYNWNILDITPILIYTTSYRSSMEQNDLQNLYPRQEIEPNGMVTITNNAELSTIDRWIQDSLHRGVDIYIMSPRHQSCDVNPHLFSKLISNEDDLIKVIFLSDQMIEYMELLEEIYHSDEMDPTIHENFLRKCPICNLLFGNM